MRKFLVFLFKFLVPLGIVLYPIINNLQWTVGGYIGAGSALVLFIILWFKLFKKMYKDIVFKEQHETVVERSISFWTNLKYELAQFIRVGILFAILNAISYFIVDINKFIIYIMASCFIGAVIKIGGSREFKRQEQLVE